MRLRSANQRARRRPWRPTLRALEPPKVDFNEVTDYLNRQISGAYGLPPSLLRRYYGMPLIRPDWRAVYGSPGF